MKGGDFPWGRLCVLNNYHARFEYLSGMVFMFFAINNMLEQQLINAFMKLTAKAGAGEIVRQLIVQVDENGNPKSWSPAEMQQAIDFLNSKVNSFNRNDAIQVIHSLMRKYDLTSENIGTTAVGSPETDELSGVQGLQ